MNATSPTPVPAPAPPMRVLIETPSASSLVLVVSGDVDSSTAPGLGGAVTEALSRPGVTDVVVDLQAVTFLDSAGLCALAVAHREALRVGRVVLLRVGTTRAVVRPLQMTGLWDVLARTPD
ncbi:MAG: Anti-sigma factor antagonist [Klenkia sp.]|nr:Anti-sigma factor antagonist [Klenkia sp.]